MKLEEEAKQYIKRKEKQKTMTTEEVIVLNNKIIKLLEESNRKLKSLKEGVYN
jgi:hypothetical protein